MAFAARHIKMPTLAVVLNEKGMTKVCRVVKNKGIKIFAGRFLRNHIFIFEANDTFNLSR